MISAAMIEAFGLDSDDDPYDPEFCVGNSTAFIVEELSATVAVCECGNLVTKMSDSPERYVHADGRINCPAYDCPCGQRHNVPRP